MCLNYVRDGTDAGRYRIVVGRPSARLYRARRVLISSDLVPKVVRLLQRPSHLSPIDIRNVTPAGGYKPDNKLASLVNSGKDIPSTI